MVYFYWACLDFLIKKRELSTKLYLGWMQHLFLCH